MYYEPCVTEPEVLGKILLGQKRPKLVKTDTKDGVLWLFLSNYVVRFDFNLCKIKVLMVQ